MTGAIKLFKFLQGCYCLVGIDSPPPNRQSGSLNFKNLIVILFFVQYLAASFAFFLFKANSAYEYGYSFFNALTELTMLVYYPNIILKMPDILKLIERYEEFIEKSELKRLPDRSMCEIVNNFNVIPKQIHFLHDRIT